MQNYDVLNDKEGIAILTVYAIASLTDTLQDKHPIIAQEFKHEQGKDSNGMDFSFVLHP